MEEDKAITLASEYIVLAIPDASVEVTISAKVFMDGELKEVRKTMDFAEVRAAVKEADTGYIPGDALFSLTPLGEEYAKKLVESQRAKFN